MDLKIHKIDVQKYNGDVRFRVTANRPLTEDEARKEQIKQGYSPAGYGFYSFKVMEYKGLHITSWECSSSCD